ncbi:MAG: 16S rRNA (guanine(966)-N(2))-methyltransferase RsmD [Candidatus Dormibacteraceae bacterium]
MRLRVESGESGGRRLLAPSGIRPTEALVRAAIFDMLAEAVLGAAVIDLFAGSGALGIEALSRGARFAVFVERARSYATILRQNLDALGYRQRSRLEVADAIRWLEAHPADLGASSLVLLDPPYGDLSLGASLSTLDRLASPGTIVVAEHRVGAELPGLERLRRLRERRYGDSAVTVLRARP